MSEEVLPRRTARRPLPAFLPVAGLVIISAMGVAAAWLCYLLCTMYGLDSVGERRTGQWLAVTGFSLGAGLFLAFPVYAAGVWRDDSRLLRVAGVLTALITALQLLMWLI